MIKKLHPITHIGKKRDQPYPSIGRFSTKEMEGQTEGQHVKI